MERVRLLGLIREGMVSPMSEMTISFSVAIYSLTFYYMTSETTTHFSVCSECQSFVYQNCRISYSIQVF